MSNDLILAYGREHKVCSYNHYIPIRYLSMQLVLDTLYYDRESLQRDCVANQI